MKKILIVLVILAVAISGVFAEGDEGLVGSGSITVRGKIGVGDVGFYVQDFNVAAVDLKTNADIQPEGDGVVVGKWTFSSVSQPEDTKFTVAYDTTPLTSETVAGSYEFDVSESGTSNPAYSEGVITVGGSSLNLERSLKVNLKSAIGDGASPGEDFVGTITVSLTTDTDTGSEE